MALGCFLAYIRESSTRIQSFRRLRPRPLGHPGFMVAVMPPWPVSASAMMGFLRSMACENPGNKVTRLHFRGRNRKRCKTILEVRSLVMTLSDPYYIIYRPSFNPPVSQNQNPKPPQTAAQLKHPIPPHEGGPVAVFPFLPAKGQVIHRRRRRAVGRAHAAALLVLLAIVEELSTEELVHLA